MKNVLSTVFFVAFVFKGITQPLLPLSSSTKQEVFLNLAFSPHLTTQLGYQQFLGAENKKWLVGSKLTLAPLAGSLDGYKLSLFGGVSMLEGGRFHLMVTPELFYAYHRDRSGTIHGLGTDLEILPYWIGNKWTRGVSLQWHHTALAYIKHSESSKETFGERYPGGDTGFPKNGWYKNTADQFKLGFRAGRQIGEKWATELAVGTQFILQKQRITFAFSHGQIPLYLGGNLRYKIE